MTITSLDSVEKPYTGLSLHKDGVGGHFDSRMVTLSSRKDKGKVISFTLAFNFLFSSSHVTCIIFWPTSTKLQASDIEDIIISSSVSTIGSKI